MGLIGFYAGSFDPFTNGHLQIVKKAARCFDKVIIGIGHNKDKSEHFTEYLCLPIMKVSTPMRYTDLSILC